MILIDLAIKSVLLAAIGWIAVFALRRSSASTRHLALVLTLVGVCLLVPASLLIPKWQVPFIKVTHVTQATSPMDGAPSATDMSPVVPAPRSAIDFQTLVIGVWAGIAGFLCLVVIIRLIRLGRMERRLQMLADPALQALVSDQCRRSGKHVLLLEGADTEPPMVWGHNRPVLLLPSHSRTWPEDRLHSVILHELAHIDRKDWIASIFAQLACATFWFNPFAWLILKQIETESETAADDQVLGLGISPTNYASHLVEVGKELRRAIASPRVTMAMARPGKLDRRVRTILEDRRCRRTSRGAATLGLIGVVALIVGGVSAAEPTVVHRVLESGPEVTVEVTPDQKSNPLFDGANSDWTQKSTAESVDLDEMSPDQGETTTSKNPVTPPIVVAPKVSAPSTSTVLTAKKQGKQPKAELKSSNGEVSISGADVDFDAKDIEAEIKEARIEANREIDKAMKDVKSSTKDLKDLKGLKSLMGSISDITIGTTNAALKAVKGLGKKETKAAIEKATKALKQLHAPPNPDHH